MDISVYIYTYIYIRLYMYVAILGKKKQRDYALIPTSLFRDYLPIGGFYC